MPEHVTIPISVFELSITYVRPDVKLWVDRAAVVQGIFEALSPWQPNVDDIEVITVGKPSEQGVKFRLPTQRVFFFFGPSGCKFTKEAATWADAGEMIMILDSALKVLAGVSGVAFGRRVATLSLHLQPKTISFREILRPFLVPQIARLEDTPTEAMAMVARWKGRRVTLDGSAALANAVFVQSEREFEANISYDEIRATVLNDELRLFELLGVEEVAS